MGENQINTIEGLATLIQRTMASKEDVHGLGNEIKRLEEKVDHGFARIEKLLIGAYLKIPYSVANFEFRMQTAQISSSYSPVALLNLRGFHSKFKIFAAKENFEIGSKDHRRRIEALEGDLKRLKEALAL